MKINKIILGTVQFGLQYGINNSSGQISEREAFRILDYSFEQGIEYIDTAAAYGVSEKILGSYFLINKDKNPQIITKLHFGKHQTCEESLYQSLDNLSLNSVDTLLFHSFGDYVFHKNELEELVKSHKGKLFNKIGVSVYTNEEIDNLVAESLIDVVQTPFNLLDNEKQRGACLKNIQSSGKEVHTRSVFLQGLFFKPLENFPKSLEVLKKPIQEIIELSSIYNIKMNELALSYALTKEYIDGVLFGVDSLEQLKKNLHQNQEAIPIDLINKIDAINITNKELLNPSKWQI